MKKILSAILVLALFFSLTSVAFGLAPEPGKVRVTNQTITVNGETIPMEAYNIDGSNYFKLRDLAYILSGTTSQFSVNYDHEKKLITANSGNEYLVVGKEMSIGADRSGSCRPSTQQTLFNGEHSSAYAYNIGGNNFFKLRDLGEIFNFRVDYDVQTRTVMIESADYNPDLTYINVHCAALTQEDGYHAYAYHVEYSGIASAEITGVKLDGKTIPFENIGKQELEKVVEQLESEDPFHGGARYYFNHNALSQGQHTLSVQMTIYHEGGATAEMITLEHSFTRQ